MISFIVPTHNYGTYLKKCIFSILKNNQKFVKEIIIVNDASTDKTKNIYFKNFKKFKKIKYFEKNFNSLTKSVNFGIKRSKSQWISKVDADDWVSSRYAYHYYNFLKKDNFDFVYSDLIIVNNKNKNSRIKKQKIEGITRFLKYPVGSGTIFKKKLWSRVGGFDENLFYQDDYDFWLKINKLNYIKIGYLEKQLYYYRFHNSNMSKNIVKKNIAKIFLIFKNFLKL